MSHQAMTWLLRDGPHPTDLDRDGEPYGRARARAMRAVLAPICNAANRDGENAFPGLEAIVEESLYSKSQALEVLDDAQSEGWIEVTKRGRGRGHATVYRLLFDRRQRNVRPPDLSGEPPPDWSDGQNVRQPPDLSTDRKGPIDNAKRSDFQPEKVRSASPHKEYTTEVTTEERNTRGTSPAVLPLRDDHHEAQEHRPARAQDHIDRRGQQLVALVAHRLADQHPDTVVARLYAPWDAGCRVALGRRLAALEAGGWPPDTLAVELAGIVYEPDRLTSIAGLIKHRADELEDRPVVLTAAEHAAPARNRAAVDEQRIAATHGRNLALAGIPADEIAYLLTETYRAGAPDVLAAALAAAGVDPATVTPAPARYDTELEVWT